MTGTRGLAADVLVRRRGFDVTVRLDVQPGEVVAMLGPNGAGKSTFLRALAGLVPLDAGSVTMDGEVWDDGRSRSVPTERRRLGMVFQDYLLFGHLSSLENVAFGLRAKGTGRSQARQEAAGWLDRLAVGEVADVRPGRLSGGQAQRVALARALATRPRLLLMDEPLAALDAGTRAAVRSGLRRHLRDYAGVTVLVTHDPLDAMVLGDRLVVVERGEVVQQGSPSAVARQPRTDYVARLVGLNLLRGNASGRLVDLVGGGQVTVATPPGDGDAFVAFPPSAVSLYTERPHGSARNVWSGVVAGVEQHSGVVRVTVDGAPPVLADVTAAAVAELDLVAGAQVWVAVKATEISAYPA